MAPARPALHLKGHIRKPIEYSLRALALVIFVIQILQIMYTNTEEILLTLSFTLTFAMVGMTPPFMEVFFLLSVV